MATTPRKRTTAKRKTPKRLTRSTTPSVTIEFKGLLSFLILHELSSSKLYGEQLAERIGNRKGSPLTPGTIYPALKKLREERLVTFSRDGRKKVYKLTSKGKKELSAQYKLFGRYFAGLKAKIPRGKSKKKRVVKKGKVKKKGARRRKKS